MGEIPVTTAVLKIDLQCFCEGCIPKICKPVKNTKGYQDMKIDRQEELVTVTGAMDMKALTEMLKENLKKNVEIVPPKKNLKKNVENVEIVPPKKNLKKNVEIVPPKKNLKKNVEIVPQKKNVEIVQLKKVVQKKSETGITRREVVEEREARQAAAGIRLKKSVREITRRVVVVVEEMEVRQVVEEEMEATRRNFRSRRG